jgi:hypothetical protein
MRMCVCVCVCVCEKDWRGRKRGTVVWSDTRAASQAFERTHKREHKKEHRVSVVTYIFHNLGQLLRLLGAITSCFD